MKQEDWEKALAQARANMGRLAGKVETMTPEEYKEFALARRQQIRPLLVEQIEDLARTPDDVFAKNRGISLEEATCFLAPYRTGSAEEVFEQQLAEMRATPAEELYARELAMLHRVSTATDVSPVPEHLG